MRLTAPSPQPPRSSRRAVVVLVAGVLPAVLLAGCARAGGEPFQPTLNTTVRLDADAAVGQTVNPAGDVVAGVDLLLATFDAAVDPAGELQVDLVDPEAGDVLATTAIPGTAITDLAWATARFDPPAPVPDVVLVRAEWTGATPLALFANAPEGRVRSGALANDPYGGGQLVVDGRPRTGDLAFRVRGAGGAGAAAEQAREVLASAGGRLLAAPVFAVVWLLLLLAAGAAAVWGLRQRYPDDTDAAPPATTGPQI